MDCRQLLADKLADKVADSRHPEGYAMARQRSASKLHQLTVREILAAGEGDHTDGGWLLPRIRGSSANWVFRFTAPSGRRREMGLGPARRSSTAQGGRVGQAGP